MTPSTENKAKVHHGCTSAVLTFAATLVYRVLDARRANTTVLLPGGRSIVGFLQAMVDLAEDQERKKLLPFLQLFEVDAFQSTPERQTTNLDVLERCLMAPALKEGLLRREQLHPFLFTDNRQHDLERYAKELRAYGEAPHVIVLACGGGEISEGVEDPGHVAGLFPNFPEVWNSPEPFACYSGCPKPPSERVTATPRLIRSAELVIGLLLGNERLNAWHNYRSDRQVCEVPLKLLDEAQRAYLCTDVLMSSD